MNNEQQTYVLRKPVGYKVRNEDAEKRFDVLFEELYTKYSNEELGKQIGKTAEQLRKFASKKSWYKPRKKGTK